MNAGGETIYIVATVRRWNIDEFARRASAVAASSIFHFTEMTPLGAKTYLRDRGFPVRL